MYRIFVSVIILLWAAAAGAQPQLANPASVNCVQQEGTLSIERRPDGGEYGVCVFADNYQCEEWALLRGECPRRGAARDRLRHSGGALLRYHRRPLFRRLGTRRNARTR